MLDSWDHVWTQAQGTHLLMRHTALERSVSLSVRVGFLCECRFGKALLSYLKENAT